MEMRINIKQLVFVSVWPLIIIVALLLSTTRSYMDILARTEKFGWLLGIFGASLTLLVIGLNMLTSEKDVEEK